MLRKAILALCLVLGIHSVNLSVAADAQRASGVSRIGVLSPFPSSFGAGPSFEAFRQTLRELGYVDGRNVALEYRWADGRSDRLSNLAAELVQLGVDVIFSAWCTPAALATRRQRARFLSSSPGWVTPLAWGWSQASPGPVATSQAPRSLQRRRSASSLSCSRMWSQESLESGPS
jgi:hypothetical protein